MSDDGGLTAAAADPKNLIREGFRIDGITAGECRTIFLDWVLSLPDGVQPVAAMQVMLDRYAGAAPKHPMVQVLTEGRDAAAEQPRRRGGRAGRFGG